MSWCFSLFDSSSLFVSFLLLILFFFFFFYSFDILICDISFFLDLFSSVLSCLADRWL